MALLMCSIFVVTSFILLGLAIQIDLIKPQLQEVAEYTASTIVDLVTLASQTDAETLLLVKELKIPPSIAERGFTITLNEQNEHAYVHVYLTFLTPVSVDVPLNLNSSLEVKVVKYDDGCPSELEISVSEKLHSGLNHTSVWCFKKYNGPIYIGLSSESELMESGEIISSQAFLKYRSMINNYVVLKRVVETCML